MSGNDNQKDSNWPVPVWGKDSEIDSIFSHIGEHFNKRAYFSMDCYLTALNELCAAREKFIETYDICVDYRKLGKYFADEIQEYIRSINTMKNTIPDMSGNFSMAREVSRALGDMVRNDVKLLRIIDRDKEAMMTDIEEATKLTI